jgi:hypothetical protein
MTRRVAVTFAALLSLVLLAAVNAGPAQTSAAEGASLPEDGAPGLAGASTGTPSLIQGTFGARGNFELVSPSADGGLMHYWRNDDVPQLPWSGPAYFGQELGRVEGLSLIQGDYGNPGNLELVATAGGRLYHLFRGPQGWGGPQLIGQGVAPNPSLIQSAFGSRGNFELAVPSASGGIDFYWRDNDSPSLPWRGPYRLGEQLGRVEGLSLIQGNYGNPGNLELASRTSERLDFSTRGLNGWTLPARLADRMDPVPVRGAAALRKGYTEHLGPLVSAPGKGGPNELGRPSAGSDGIRGTDLGTSFELGDRLAFGFGDSWVPDNRTGADDDSLAWTRASSVDRFEIPRLQWVARPGGRFAPLVVALPGARHGAMEVPVGGVTAGGRNYVFFVGGWDGDRETYSESMLGHMTPETLSTGVLAGDHIARSERFLNISAIEQDGYVYIYGSGRPRRSPVFLARAKAEDLPYRDRWAYFRGTRAGRPVFGPWESSAAPVVSDPCVGELSISKHTATGLYLMTYNCAGAPSPGYHLVTATTPWGVWSRPEVILDWSPTDGGYGVTMHSPVTNYRPDTDSWQIPDDGLAEPDSLVAPPPNAAPFGLGVSGGGYGPYQVPRWFSSSGNAHTIVYAHSSWNPYKVHLMRSVLVTPGTTVQRPRYGSGLPPPVLLNGDFRLGLVGWQQRGTPFRVVPAKGRNYVSTNVPEAGGEAAQGSLYQDFTLDSTVREIAFRVHGGHGTPADFTRRAVASVRLYHRGQIVRESFGLDRNDRDLNVVSEPPRVACSAD